MLIYMLQALSVPYCQSTSMSVCMLMAMYMSSYLRLNMSETKADSGLFPIGSL